MILNKKIKNAVFKKPYSFYLIFFFSLYLFFNIWINKLYITYEVLFYSYYGILLGLLIVVVAFLVGLSINLMIIKFKEYKNFNYNTGGFTSLAIFFGFMGGACSGCIAGLFPAFVGFFFGSAVSLGIFPLKGIELQLLSIILLTISIKILSRNNLCEVKNKNI
jgi:hypothetical protein